MEWSVKNVPWTIIWTWWLKAERLKFSREREWIAFSCSSQLKEWRTPICMDCWCVVRSTSKDWECMSYKYRVTVMTARNGHTRCLRNIEWEHRFKWQKRVVCYRILAVDLWRSRKPQSEDILGCDSYGTKLPNQLTQDIYLKRSKCCNKTSQACCN